MYYETLFEALNIQAENIFQQAAEFEFFGFKLFETLEQSWYQIPKEAEWDIYCLGPKEDSKQGYEIIKISRDQRYLLTPSTFRFEYCEPIHRSWLDDGEANKIRQKIKSGGENLGTILNKAYIDVLLGASSSHTLPVEEELGETLANVYSTLVIDGFNPNTFIFPKHLEAKLVNRGVIERKTRSTKQHIGTTTSGQAAYWSTDLPGDTGLIFDSSIGITIFRKPIFRLKKSASLKIGVCGYFELNPIIKNSKGIVVLTGIDKALHLKKSQGVRAAMDVIQYVNLGRIEELKAIESQDFDLKKLIKICEEINLSFTNECYLAVAALIRTLLNHVPPIFGYESFQEVANNYAGRSIKGNLLKLQTSSRNISNTHLHSKIGKSEALPNATQIDFRPDLDVLLAEIVKILK